MARIDKSKLTKLEIVRVASKMFLEKGYTNTSIKAIANELEMSTGNLTFHFPTKEHLLAELVEMLRKFQWNLIEKEADEGVSSLLAICIELMTVASACEESEIAKDFFLSTYSSPVCLDYIRKSAVERAKIIFAEYCDGWTDEQYAEAEILISGINYATLMTTESPATLETRIRGALNQTMLIYNVPEKIRNQKIEKVLSINCRELGNRVFKEFIKYVDECAENALKDALFK
ncbi:MAG: TetR/AcrR family transcriptional regulator [Ruminococcaceae bacterium]|nr:TetR/AcrR family transcriptional regulator [Oscillospiraceae bacterium]